MTDMNGRAVATLNPVGVIEQVMIQGDLTKLSPADRVSYYARVCQSLGLNPHTRPFDYINLNGKLTLYALRGATDQIRGAHGVTVKIISREKLDDVYIVTARASTPDGREDESIGAVSVAGLKGEQLANAYMKAETKAKRRVTLSLIGLGMLDETEVDAAADARRVVVDHQTGEIIDHPPTAPSKVDSRPAKPVSMNDFRALVESCLPLGIPEPKLPADVTPSQLGKIFVALQTKRTQFERLREAEARAAQEGIDVDPLPGTAKRAEVDERIRFLEERIRLSRAASDGDEWDGDVPPEEELTV